MGKEEIERIKEANPIADVVSRYVRLRGSGRCLTGHCPWHDDQHASFAVFPKTGTFYCFVCNKGGDVITFIQEMEGVDFKEALEILGGGRLRKLKQPIPKHLKRPGRVEQFKLEKDDYRILKASAVLYHTALFVNRKALRYVLERGISLRTIRKCMVGFARGDRLGRYITFKHLSMERAHALGLFSPYGEFFQGRVTVPEWDCQGRIIHMTGRTIVGDEPKYLFLPGLPKPVYGLARVSRGPVFLVEGVFDWLTLLEWGYQALCLLGTHLKEQYARLLQRREVYLVLDNDEPGRDAAREIASKLRGARIIALPEGIKDPNELGQKERGKEIFARLIEEVR